MKPHNHIAVLRLLVRGLSDKEIGRELGLSFYTVNYYTSCLYKHFGVSGSTARYKLVYKLLAEVMDKRGVSFDVAVDDYTENFLCQYLKALSHSRSLAARTRSINAKKFRSAMTHVERSEPFTV